MIETKTEGTVDGFPMHLAAVMQTKGICHRKTYHGACPDEGLRNERNEPKCKWNHDAAEIQKFKDKVEQDFLRLHWKEMMDADKKGSLMQMLNDLKEKHPSYKTGDDSGHKRE